MAAQSLADQAGILSVYVHVIRFKEINFLLLKLTNPRLMSQLPAETLHVTDGSV